MRSKTSFAGSVVLALFGVACAGCPQAPVIHARVVGTVVDAASQRPLAGVEVSSHDQSATTDGDGRYSLEITAGVRELTFAAPDGQRLRKYVVALDATDLRLDALVPAAGASPTPGLLLQRGFWSDAEEESLPKDAGNRALVSGTDAFGNEDTFFTPSSPYGADAAVWAPMGDVFYFTDTSTATRRNLMHQHGLHRFEPATGTTTPMWIDEAPPDIIAIAPDGHALVASNSSSLFMFDGLLGPRVSHRVVLAATVERRRNLRWIAWGPSEDIYVSVIDPIGPNTYTLRMMRLSSTGVTIDERFLQDADRPVPLADGGLVYWYFGSDVDEPVIRLRDAGGQTRDLMKGDVFPAAFDRATNALTYRLGDELHWRDLGTSLDLVIVQSVNSVTTRTEPRRVGTTPTPSE